MVRPLSQPAGYVHILRAINQAPDLGQHLQMAARKQALVPAVALSQTLRKATLNTISKVKIALSLFPRYAFSRKKNYDDTLAKLIYDACSCRIRTQSCR